jgi:hypothetical protein
MILRFIPLQEIQHYKCQSTTSAITILWILEPCHSVRLEPMFTSKVVRLIVIGPMNLVKGTEVIIFVRIPHYGLLCRVISLPNGLSRPWA